MASRWLNKSQYYVNFSDPAYFLSCQTFPCKNNSVLLLGSVRRDVFGMLNLFDLQKLVTSSVREVNACFSTSQGPKRKKGPVACVLELQKNYQHIYSPNITNNKWESVFY